MYNFDYVKPASVADAVAALQGEDAQAIAGGQTLIATMKQRLAQPRTLVDLTGITEMQGISVDGGVVSVGAGARHAEVAGSAEVRGAIPALADLAGKIGAPQVRNRGTLGGSIANNDPSACYPAAVLGLGATVVTNAREIAAADFFQGLYTTSLNEGEVVTAVKFPVAAAASWQKFEQPASRFSLVGVFVAKVEGEVRVAVTGASEEGVFRAAALEQALASDFSAAAVEGASVSSAGMIADLHGTPDYRANLVKVMTKRAVEAMS